MNNRNNLKSAILEHDYITFTVTPDTMTSLNLSSLTFRTRVNGVNATAERWALFSSVDGFTAGSQIAEGKSSTANKWLNHVIDLSDAKYQGLTRAIEFRLYIYGGNKNRGSFTGFDKVILNGSIIRKQQALGRVEQKLLLFISSSAHSVKERPQT